MTYRPEILDPKQELQLKRIRELKMNSGVTIFDHYGMMLKDLIKVRHPDKVLKPQDIEDLCSNHNQTTSIDELGLWVYYPWKNSLLHIIGQDDFIELRTSRNLYKITEAERETLVRKKVGIIGLSVGNTIALAIAMERSAGELRLADYDTLELSNLNRIRSNLHELGMPKTIIAAREIAELDPFLKVKCFENGITEENLEQFLEEDGKLDALIEECDGLYVKILARQKARKKGIPVFMETSDRGMIDVERFDLEPERPILHGMIDHLDLNVVKDLKTSEEKIPYLMPMVGIDTMSVRLKASALEVGNTIGTWPQLGTSVMLGGAVLADTYRKAMLGQFKDSGRFIIDPDEHLNGKSSLNNSNGSENERFIRKALSKEKMAQLAASHIEKNSAEIDVDVIERVVDAACQAPSGGNSQPWKFYFNQNNLFVYLDASRSDSYMDYRHSASYMAIGSCIENAKIQAQAEGFEMKVHYFEDISSDPMICRCTFEKGIGNDLAELQPYIRTRYTDRSIALEGKLPEELLSRIKNAKQSYPDIELQYFSDQQEIEALGAVISSGDWLRVMNLDSHRDFIQEEMRWARSDLERSRDGIFVEELNLSPSDLAGLSLLKDERVIEFLNSEDKGHGLKDISKKTVRNSQLMIFGSARNFAKSAFLESGQFTEKVWLEATRLGVGFQMMNVPLAFLLRKKMNDLDGLNNVFREELKKMFNQMEKLVPDYGEKTDLFILRLFRSIKQERTSVRMNYKEVLEIE